MHFDFKNRDYILYNDKEWFIKFIPILILCVIFLVTIFRILFKTKNSLYQITLKASSRHINDIKKGNNLLFFLESI